MRKRRGRRMWGQGAGAALEISAWVSRQQAEPRGEGSHQGSG